MSETKTKAHKPYGLLVLHCDCGWKTSKKKEDTEPPTKCEACGKEGKATFHDDVACMIMTLTELRSRRVQDHAEKSSLRIFQLSKNRWVVLDEDCPMTVSYGDEKGRGFMTMKAVCGPSDWQTVMKYIRDHTPELPGYLLR